MGTIRFVVGDVSSSIGLLRQAAQVDQAAIDRLMKASTGALFPAFYDEEQTASSVAHIAHVDPLLIDDGTYFVMEVGTEIVACGGWSRRDKLFTGTADQEGRARLLDPVTEPARVRAMFVNESWTRRGLGTQILSACEGAAREEGFSRLALMATLPGYALYKRYGFRELEWTSVVLPDGVAIPCVAMEKDVLPA